MRYWMLILLGAGCGQMYPASGGQPAPASAPGSPPGASGDPAPSQGRAPGDPYAEAAPEPAHPLPAREPAARRDPTRTDRAPGGSPGKAGGAPGKTGGAPGKTGEPPRSPPAASGDAPSMAQQMVDAHNLVRAKHCAAPLTWSPKLAQVAQRWANSLRDKGCAFGHSNGAYGENLAAGTTGMLDPEAVVKMWYDEVAQYKFPDGGFAMQTGHFTQVVWRATTEVGCGRSQCKGMDLWVCEYDPPGNWEGQYRDNVRPVGCR
jgi:uncharacterized protein YkwD